MAQDDIIGQCKQCRRAVKVQHLDRDGYCCFCTQTPRPTTRQAADTKTPTTRTRQD